MILYTKYNVHTNNLMIRLIFQLLLFESTQIWFYNEIVVFCLRTNCNNLIIALAVCSYKNVLVLSIFRFQYNCGIPNQPSVLDNTKRYL